EGGHETPLEGQTWDRCAGVLLRARSGDERDVDLHIAHLEGEAVRDAQLELHALPARDRDARFGGAVDRAGALEDLHERTIRLLGGGRGGHPEGAEARSPRPRPTEARRAAPRARAPHRGWL